MISTAQTSRRPLRAQRAAQLALLVAAIVLLLAGCTPGTTALPPLVATAGVDVPAHTASRVADGVPIGTLMAREVATPGVLASPGVVTQPGPSPLPSRRAAGATAAGVTLSTPLPGDRLPTISYTALPPEAQRVLQLIARGGPFPYRQDGAVFQNREGLLPHHPVGYYREYTVIMPGSSDRGPRRLVSGQKNEVYYTADHYASFERVVP